MVAVKPVKMELELVNVELVAHKLLLVNLQAVVQIMIQQTLVKVAVAQTVPLAAVAAEVGTEEVSEPVQMEPLAVVQDTCILLLLLQIIPVVVC